MKKSIREFKKFLDKVIHARDLTGDDTLFKKFYFSCMNVQLETLKDFHFATDLINLLKAYEFKESKSINEELDEIIKEARKDRKE